MGANDCVVCRAVVSDSFFLLRAFLILFVASAIFDCRLPMSTEEEEKRQVGALVWWGDDEIEARGLQDLRIFAFAALGLALDATIGIKTITIHHG